MHATRVVLLSLAMGAALALAEPGLECQDATPHFAVRHSPREGSPFIGSADATDTLVLFTDYQ